MKQTERGTSLVAAMPPELELRRTEGFFVLDADGKKYIDFVMGWCVGNLGWDQTELSRQMDRYEGPDYVFPGFAYKPWEELADILSSAAPGDLRRCFRATGGSEAVDIALQAAMVYTGRTGFLSLEGSYHGNCIGGLSVGSSESRRSVKNLLPNCFKISPPLDGSALKKIETRLRSRKIAAFIMEPVPISLGVLLPEAEFMRALRHLCRKYGTLLIMDEVATGFGRTGRLFASEHFGLKPDLMCLGKAITAGLSGLGAVLMIPSVAKTMKASGNFYSTYGWHPRSAHAALTAVRYLLKNKNALMKNVAAMSAYFQTRLSGFDFGGPVEVRAKGLAIAIDVKDRSAAVRIQKRCRLKGLLVGAENSAVLLFPPLNIPSGVAEKGLDILEECVSKQEVSR